MSLQQILKNKPSFKYDADISPLALERWNPNITAAAADDGENQINILGIVGDDWYSENTTDIALAKYLNSIPGQDVVVNINSPGGDAFQGLAMYSLLKEHSGKVTVNVLSLAASAASIVAMAGDEVRIARSGFLMIHNAWLYAVGNKHELKAAADFLDTIDQALADIYQTETGIDINEITDIMDGETWIAGKAAVDEGWATGFLASDKTEQSSNNSMASIKKLDQALAKSGMPRSKRRELLNEFKTDMQNAVENGTHNATNNMQNAVEIKFDPLPRVKFDF